MQKFFAISPFNIGPLRAVYILTESLKSRLFFLLSGTITGVLVI